MEEETAANVPEEQGEEIEPEPEPEVTEEAPAEEVSFKQ